jgi:hypothetical protein
MNSPDHLERLPAPVRAALAWVRLNAQAYGFRDFYEAATALGVYDVERPHMDREALRVLANHAENAAR